MDKHMDHYSELGVTPQAEPEVIRAVYRALAQRYHPDRQMGSSQDADDKMARINRAYDVLSQPETRRAYDRIRTELRPACVSNQRQVASRQVSLRVVQPYLTTYDRHGRLQAYA